MNTINTPNTICQSCGMPLNKDPQKGGTHADHSISDTYCSFCYQEGKFTDEGISLQEKIEKNIQIAVKMGFSEANAKEMATSIIPKLKRWNT